MTKVVLITDHFAAGGIGVVVFQHAMWMRRRGLTVAIACNRRGAVPENEWERLAPGRMAALREAGVSLQPLVTEELDGFLRSLSHDARLLVHASWRGRTLARAVALSQMQCKPVYFLHSACESAKVVMNPTLRRNLLSAAVVVTGSSLVETDFRHIVKEVPMIILNYGASTSAGDGNSSSHMASARSVLFIGRPNRVKGAHLLPRIAELLQPHGVRLTVHGVWRGGVLRAERHPNIATTKGAVTDAQMSALIRQHGVLIVPSTRGEGQPLVVLEAMACGTPVVATTYATGGLWAGHPVLVRPPRADHIAEAVMRLLDTPEGCERSRQGLLQAQQHTWESHVGELLNRLGWNK